MNATVRVLLPVTLRDVETSVVDSRKMSGYLYERLHGCRTNPRLILGNHMLRTATKMRNDGFRRVRRQLVIVGLAKALDPDERIAFSLRDAGLFWHRVTNELLDTAAHSTSAFERMTRERVDNSFNPQRVDDYIAWFIDRNKENPSAYFRKRLSQHEQKVLDAVCKDDITIAEAASRLYGSCGKLDIEKTKERLRGALHRLAEALRFHRPQQCEVPEKRLP